ncbi:MAG: 4-hydroxy-tetrahydrodipicolinate synthase [Ruminococcus sp.]|nr:4-hydroxy-tetrahydrodipicolinate synthase [Candidatus Copronaster equi]
MKQTVFKGSACALVTPFDESRKIDYKTLKKLIDFQIDNSTDAIVICGTTGESPVLTTREHKQIIKSTVRYVNGRVPVIAGTGANNTDEAIKKSQAAEALGADALLIVTPYYNKASQSGLIEHYQSISRSVNLPIIVYNVPSRTGLDIKPETYRELCKIDNIVATKEANGNISALAQTIALCKNELDIYCGNDDQTAPFTAMGAKGCISVLANILPQEAHDIAITGIDGDTDLSAHLQYKYLDICNSLFCDVNPIPVKYAMSLLGLCNDYYRLPLTKLSEKNQQKIIKVLKRHNLIE